MLIDRWSANIKVYQLSYVNDEGAMANVFRKVDVYAHTARIDNYPNTILESLCCGTEVVSFEVGGISDFSVNFQSLNLVKPFDNDEFADKLRVIFMKRNLKEFTLDRADVEFSNEMNPLLNVYENENN